MKEVVRKHRKSIGIVKNNVGVVAISNSYLGKNNINKANISEDEKIAAWKQYFRSTNRFKRLSKQLTADDLSDFEDSWARYCVQFEDLKSSEEDQLEMLVSYKLRLDDNRKDYKDVQEAESTIRKMMVDQGLNEEKELDLEVTEHQMIWEMLSSNKRLKQEVNKQFNELNGRYTTIFESLNATRVQREQFEKIGGDTFLMLVKSLNEYDKRKEVGRYNELMKLATQKQLVELKKDHKFIDNNIEPIIMDGKDYKDKYEKGKKEQAYE